MILTFVTEQFVQRLSPLVHIIRRRPEGEEEEKAAVSRIIEETLTLCWFDITSQSLNQASIV